MTNQERARYSRQLLLAEVGEAGQARLAKVSVLVVGAGGLGTPVLHHLAASGIGRLGIVEFDTVDVSNLHRQTLYGTNDVGNAKLASAKARLSEINPAVAVTPHATRLTAENADSLLAGYDLVVDGSDTFATRYVVNDAAIAAGIPNVYASVSQFSGQASVLHAENGPCYRCLFPAPPPAGLVPSCDEGGVLGVVPAIMGTIQATEVLKLVLGIGEPLIGRLLLYDALAMETRQLRFDRDPDCPACGERRQRLAVDASPEITVGELQERLNRPGPPVLLDVREAVEHQEFNLGGQLIPLGMLEARAFELDRDREMVVYCASGGRSGRAVQMLRERGYDARSLRGGVGAWRSLQPTP